MGRKPIGAHPLTQVERNRRYRRKQRAARLRAELQVLNRDPALRAMPKRDGLDWWATPPDLCAAFARMVEPVLPRGLIWEAAAGNGVLGDAIAAKGRELLMSDVHPRRADVLAHDFIKGEPLEAARGAILATNPPFAKSGLGDRFIARAIGLLDAGFLNGVVLLQRAGADSTDGRAVLFDRAAHEFRCCWRPRWIEDSGGGGRWWFSWFVWLRNWSGQPVITRIRKQSLKLETAIVVELPTPVSLDVSAEFGVGGEDGKGR